MSDGLRTTLQELARHWRDMHKIPHSAYRQACQCADQLQAALLEVEARAPQEPPTELHDAIMNVPCEPPSTLTNAAGASFKRAYQLGHRDARHDAAELVAAAAEGRDTPLSCANCHHVEPHTASTAGGGPADPFDGCTHPGCDCGYDSRRYQFEAQIVAAGRDTPPPITITGRTAQSYILEAEARDTPPPIPVSDDNTANKQFQVGGDTPQEPPVK